VNTVGIGDGETSFWYDDAWHNDDGMADRFPALHMVFFSYNKSANGIFQPSFSAKRTVRRTNSTRTGPCKKNKQYGGAGLFAFGVQDTQFVVPRLTSGDFGTDGAGQHRSVYCPLGHHQGPARRRGGVAPSAYRQGKFEGKV